MTIKIYSGFSKRHNSTKQPTGGTDITAILKAPCNIVSPVFEVSASYATYNYVYVASWGRYYYVTDVTYITNDIVQLHCESDPMASGKSAIGAVSAPVEFTTSSSNLLMTDPRNRPTFKYEKKSTTLLNLGNNGFSNSTGRYVCGIVCDLGLKYFVFDQSGMDTLCQALFKSSFIQAIHNDFYDMKNVLVSCTWVPFTGFSLSASTIIMISGEPLEDNNGNSVAASYITVRYKTISAGNVTIGYPFDNDYNVDNYLDAPPYTSGSIYIPFVGVVPFDADIFFNDKTCDLTCVLDTYTGDMAYELFDSAANVISTYQGCCGTSIPIAGQTTSPAGAIASGLSAIGGAAGIIGGLATGGVGAIAAGAGALVAGALGTQKSMEHHTQVNGVLSSGVSSQLPNAAVVTVRSRKPAESAIETAWNADNGFTYYKDATISSLSGFIKCSGASVGGTLTPGEKNQINSYMNSGFYYE